MKSAYPAVLHSEDNRFWVEFPDLEGCFSDGDTAAEAVYNASKALGLYLCSLSEDSIPFPQASEISSLFPTDGFTALVAPDPFIYRKNTHF